MVLFLRFLNKRENFHQVAIFLVVIQSIADSIYIRPLEALVVNGNGCNPPRGHV